MGYSTLAQLLIVDIAPSAFAVAMDSATAASVYGMRFPVTARSRDDPRLLGWRMVDGKSQALQQRHLAELEAEGRKMKDQPKEDTPGSGMLAAIAHFDALQASAKKPAVIKAEVVEFEAAPLSEVIAEAGRGQGQDGPGLSLRDRLLRQAAAGKVLGCWCDLQLRAATAASVYRMRFPVTARSRDDPRLLGWRMVDGKSQALQQRHLAELEAEGRKMKDQPKEDTPGSGMLAAIAHFDALQSAKKPVIKAEDDIAQFVQAAGKVLGCWCDLQLRAGTLAQLLIVDIAPSAFAVAMDSATAASVYGMRFPVTARSRDDPRLLGWRMVDGKSQALQQRHLAELEAEGRKMKDQPKEDTPGSGMLAAIAHFDALQASAKKPAVIKAEVVEFEAAPLSEVIAEAGQGQGQDGPGLALRDRLLRQAAGKVLGCWCDLQLRAATAASVYGMRFPVTARSRDDPRLLGWRMVDGKSQALQQRHLAELEAEGRKMKDQPKEDTPGSGMLVAIAHFDALQASAKKPAVIKAEAGREWI
ncbi:unnamed protein product [Cladocopium goreaui]|uniref:Uncharacterized protein n=1 Tax=Cladocopium goreaui TaxID=2562237 RepID=A0A9P1FEZ5_9DINO|nr:unnamed protein product [Cladocopium goreaui]